MMIEGGGGRYMGAMEMNSTTHLVAEVLTPSSAVCGVK